MGKKKSKSRHQLWSPRSREGAEALCVFHAQPIPLILSSGSKHRIADQRPCDPHRGGRAQVQETQTSQQGLGLRQDHIRGRGGHGARGRAEEQRSNSRAGHPNTPAFETGEKLAAEAVKERTLSMAQFIRNNPHCLSQHRDGHFSQSHQEEKPQDMVTNQKPKIQKPKLKHMV